MGGYHSSKWYKRNLSAQPPTLPEQAPNPRSEPHSLLTFVRRLIGLGVMGWGLSLMDNHFWLGFVVVCFGFGLLIWEVIVDPFLLRCSMWIQMAVLSAVILSFGILFTQLVSSYAPLRVDSYSPRHGDYRPDAVIAGIQWNSHLAELHVALSNPTNEDYNHLDVSIYPDRWTHKAILVPPSNGCDLTPIPGKDELFWVASTTGGANRVTATSIGKGLDFHDNAGDEFHMMASNDGYRLICSDIPPGYTIQIVFALIAPPSKLMPQAPPAGKWNMQIAEIAGIKSFFDVLDPKPATSIVKIEGRFKKNSQPFCIKHTSVVLDGS